MRRRLGGLFLAALCFAGTAAAAEPINVTSRPIARFDRADRWNRVAFLGGIVLSGPRDFGGFSGLLVEGDRLLAIGDVGTWLEARILFDGERPTGLADATLTPRRDTDGTPITRKVRGDAEAIVRDRGALLVMVEAAVDLLRYPAKGLAVDMAATPEALSLSPTIESAGRRHGVEAVLSIGGDLIIFGEGNRRTGKAIPAFRRGGGDFAVARNGPWSITDAAALPGGDAIILERRYEGGIEIGMRLRRLSRDDLAHATGTIDGPVLLEADFSAEIDNMEALAAEVRGGRIILTVMSDNNMSWLQRTLLLRFALADPLPRKKPAIAG